MDSQFEGMLSVLKTRATAYVSNPSAVNKTAYENALKPVENYLELQRGSLRSKEEEVRKIYNANKDHIGSIRSQVRSANKAATDVKQDSRIMNSLEESVKVDYTPLVVKGLIVVVLAGISTLVLG